MRVLVKGDARYRVIGPGWRKAPLVLLRYPSTLVATFLAAAVLSLSAAMAPLFLSSVADGSMRDAMAARAPGEAALKVVAYGPIRRDAVAFRQRALLEAARSIAELGEPLETIVGPEVVVVPSGGAAHRVQLATRTGFLDHVRVLARSQGAGVWLPDVVATPAGIDPGDRVEVQLHDLRVEVRVAGLYRYLAAQPLSAFWAPLSVYILPTGPRMAPPPPFLLAGPKLLVRVAEHLQASGQMRWEYPLPRGLTLEEARDLSARVQRIERDLTDPTTELGSAFSPAVALSPLSDLVRQADEARDMITWPAASVSIAGTTVAAALFGLLALYRTSRRRAELGTLWVRGMSPASLGAMAAAEAFVPTALGGGLGWWLSVRFAPALGPSHVVDATAVGASARLAGYGLAVGLGVHSLVSGTATPRGKGGGPGRSRDRTTGVPWELPALALAGAALYEMVIRGGARTVGPGAASRLDLVSVIFPILFIGGVAGLGSRGFRALLHRVGRAASRAGSAPYLAGRRLVEAGRVPSALVAVSGLSLGILIYALSLTTSIRTTAALKAGVFVGSGVAVELPPDATTGLDLPFPATTVWTVDRATLLPSGRLVRVVAVDPASFGGAAFWHETFADRPLRELLRDLSRGDGVRGPRAAAIVAGGPVPRRLTVRIAGWTMPVVATHEVRAFPGMRSGMPLVVLDRRTLEAKLAGNVRMIADFREKGHHTPR